MKKFRITVLAVMVLLICVLTAGCVAEKPAIEQSNVPDIAGNWISDNSIIYFSDKGFIEDSEKKIVDISVTEQDDRLLKMNIGDKTVFGALWNENADNIFADASNGADVTYITGSIEDNYIVLKSLIYNDETKTIGAIFDQRYKEGTNPNRDLPTVGDLFIGKWNQFESLRYVDGDFVKGDRDVVLEITENNGPVLIGTLSVSGMEPKKIAVVLSKRDDKGCRAVMIDDSGEVSSLRFTESMIFYVNSDCTRTAKFIKDGEYIPVAGLSLKTYAPFWQTNKVNILTDEGFKEITTETLPLSVTKDFGNSMIAYELSNGDKYLAKVNPINEIEAHGLSADGKTEHLMKGFFGTDGKLHTFSTASTDGESVKAIYEIVYLGYV